jgi:MFS family permease
VEVDGAPDEAAWRRERRVLVPIALCANFGFNLFAPFLPLYVRELGVDDPHEAAVWAGAALGVSPLGAALTSAFWGMLADRTGTKIMLQRSLFASVVLYLGLGVVQAPIQLFLLRAAFGLFGGFGPLMMARAAAVAPRAQVSQAVGLIQGLQLASLAVGPVLGGPLADLIGLRPTVFATAGLYCLAFVVATFGLRETERAGRQESTATSRGGLWPPFVSERRWEWPTFVATRPRVVASLRPRLSSSSFSLPRRLREGQAPWMGSLALVLLLTQVVDRGLAPILPLYVAALDVPEGLLGTTTGLLIGASGFSAAGSAAFFGRLARRVSFVPLLGGGLLGAAGFCLGMLAAPTLVLFASARIGMALLIGSVATLCYGAAARRARLDRTASTIGLLATATFLGNAGGPVLGGALGAGDLRRVFAIDTVLLLLAGLFAATVLRQLARGPLPEAGLQSRGAAMTRQEQA